MNKHEKIKKLKAEIAKLETTLCYSEVYGVYAGEIKRKLSEEAGKKGFKFFAYGGRVFKKDLRYLGDWEDNGGQGMCSVNDLIDDANLL